MSVTIWIESTLTSSSKVSGHLDLTSNKALRSRAETRPATNQAYTLNTPRFLRTVGSWEAACGGSSWARGSSQMEEAVRIFFDQDELIYLQPLRLPVQ